MLKDDKDLIVEVNMITFTHKGSFKNTERFLSKAQALKLQSILPKYGAIGVSALAKATPVLTGLTASSWNFTTDITRWGYTISWYNTNQSGNVNIAIILQYGHGTGTGGYVQGRDYINPAIQPVFDAMVEEIWKEVSSI